MDVRMELSRIVISEMREQQIIVLREVGGMRSMAIAIGIAEAIAIDRRLKGISVGRPMTHDLMASVIEQLGGQLQKIVISDLRDDTFFARLHILQDGEVIEVDSRPSDALALGVASETPVYVSDHVLDEASMT